MLSCKARLAWLTATWILTACGGSKVDEAPEGVLRRFLGAMERSAWEPEARKEAYGLLDQAAQRELKRRAEVASTLATRDFAPWEMMAPGRFVLHFQPRRRDAMRSRIQGRKAVVVVRGEGKQEQARVPMVHEGESWRVVLALPPVQRDTLAVEPGR